MAVSKFIQKGDEITPVPSVATTPLNDKHYDPVEFFINNFKILLKYFFLK